METKTNKHISKLFLFALTALFATAFGGETSRLKTIDQNSLQEVVGKAARELNVPGAYVLLQTPQGEFTVSYGTILRGGALPPQGDTRFRIASTTKTMMAAVIVQQAQEQKLNFNDPVSKYISDVPNGDQITIADLLRMRSGLSNYTDSPLISESLDTNPQKVWELSEILAIAFSKPPLFKPDSAYDYSNTNYALLGAIAEKIEKKPLQEIFQNRLFKQVGMKHTELPKKNSHTLPPPFSHGYQYGSASYALVDKPYPLTIQAAGWIGLLQPNDDTFQNPSYASAAGGVISTANDLALWINALVEGKLFSPEFYRLWLDSLRPETEVGGQEYGYGIVKMQFGPNIFYFHGGELPGFNTFIGRDRENKVTLIIWTNLAVSLDSQLTANAIMVKILDHIYVHSPLKKP